MGRLVEPPAPPRRLRHDPTRRTRSRLLPSTSPSRTGQDPIATASTKPGAVHCVDGGALVSPNVRHSAWASRCGGNMAGGRVLRDVVVVVPGILGSTLRDRS